MHTTGSALLADILANPLDDLPRLVYADWLEENGEGERAEFVRVQIECEKMKDHANGSDRRHGGGCDECNRLRDLRRREQELWADQPVGDWFTAPYDWPLYHAGQTPSGSCLIVRRGFVAEVRCRLADWIGGECGRCDGAGAVEDYEPEHIDPTGRWLGSNGSVDCPDCSRTGQASVGIGPAVVAAHPVESVVLTDRRRSEGLTCSVDQFGRAVGPARPQWMWLESDEPPTLPSLYGTPVVLGEQNIPSAVAQHLTGRLGGNPRFREYDAEGDAEKDLSQALILWARAQHLPQFVPPGDFVVPVFAHRTS